MVFPMFRWPSTKGHKFFYFPLLWQDWFLVLKILWAYLSGLMYRSTFPYFDGILPCLLLVYSLLHSF